VSKLSRRNFIALSLGASGTYLAGCGASPEPEAAPEAAAAYEGPIGAQLYTLRSVIDSDPAGVLKGLADIGYKYVEVVQASFPAVASILSDVGLQPVSMHLTPPIVTGDWDLYGRDHWDLYGIEKPATGGTLDEALSAAKDAGIEYLVMPYVHPKGRGEDLDFYKKFAATLNAAGESCTKAGLKFCYHNHAFEFEPMDGSTPLDTLIAETDAANMALELDVFWASVAGHDPAATLDTYKGRVLLTHLKDKDAALPTRYSEGVDAEAFLEVGNGSIDFAAVLKAEAATGVERHFVEQDQTPGDPLESLRQSYAHLRGIAV